jgi:hypothetical protein
MPQFPEAFVDDVASGVQRDYHKARERVGLMAENQLAGQQNLSETLRQNFATDNRVAGAVVTQALLGQDPTLANQSLAYDATAGQPWASPAAPQPPVNKA